jgi:hypothetical protein
VNPQEDPDRQREINETRKAMELGMEAEAFAKSPIGRYVLERATELGEAALEKLADVPPDDTQAIRKLQNEVRLGRLLQSWLLDAITTGANAERVFEQQQTDDLSGA